MKTVDLERVLKPRLSANERTCLSNWHGSNAAPRDPAATKAELLAAANGKSFGRRRPERPR
jgi:hypothetical protein